MKRHLPLCVLAGAIMIVGVVGFGVPVSSLWVLGFVLVCPLMMMFMMRGYARRGRPPRRTQQRRPH